MILAEPSNCFVRLVLLPFSLLQERQFRCQSAKGQKTPLSGTGMPGSQGCSLQHPCSHDIQGVLGGGSCLRPWKVLAEPQPLENLELLEAVVLCVAALKFQRKMKQHKTMYKLAHSIILRQYLVLKQDTEELDLNTSLLTTGKAIYEPKS